MRKELVVAHYQEDLSWLPSNMQVLLYDKGDKKLSVGSNVRRIDLPNVGRDINTHVTHIVRNYNDLADITIFAQGDPFPHSANFVEVIKHDTIEGMYWENTKKYLTFPRVNMQFLPLGTGLIYVYHRLCLPRYDWLEETGSQYSSASMRNIWGWIKRRAPYAAPDFFPIQMTKGLQFAITRDAIREIPLDAYEELLEISLTDPWLSYSIEYVLNMVFEKYPKLLV